MVQCFQLPIRTFLNFSLFPFRFFSFLFEFDSHEISWKRRHLSPNKSNVLPFVFDLLLHVFNIGLKSFCSLSSRNHHDFVDAAVVSKNTHLRLRGPDAHSMLRRTEAESSSVRRPPDTSWLTAVFVEDADSALQRR